MFIRPIETVIKSAEINAQEWCEGHTVDKEETARKLRARKVRKAFGKRKG